MASKTKALKLQRARKHIANHVNLKTREEQVKSTLLALRELAAEA